MHRLCTLLVALAAAVACREPQPASGDAPMKDKDPTGGETEGSSSGGPPVVLGDICENAPTIGVGRFVATIYNAASDVHGACGEGGPEVFVRVATDERADLELTVEGSGFVPRLGVLGNACSADWDSEGIACTRGLPATVLDIAAGGSVVVAIGVDPDDPVLVDASSDHDMSFALDVKTRPVLEPGARCGQPGLGRCESGSACSSGDDGTKRCTVLDADTCATAEPLALAAIEATTTMIDPSVPQTDAHAHSCMGARRPERVLELRLPAELPERAVLTATTAAADVGIALRGPGCLASDELACAAPSPSGAIASVDALAVETAGSPSIYAFVELPVDPLDDAAGELAPFAVTFELASSP